MERDWSLKEATSAHAGGMAVNSYTGKRMAGA